MLALLDRLSRLEAAGPAVSAGDARLEHAAAFTSDRRAGGHPKRSRARRAAAGAAAAVLVASAAGWLWLGGATGWLAQATAPPRVAPPDAESLDVPSPSERALARARTLQVKGRLHEALLALGGVRSGDPSWPQAQRMRAAIQRQLLTGDGTALLSPDPALEPGARR